ncbi:MAG TPA: hypothetical protein VK144_03120 [Bacillota bacterium]|nr:hypothetical protein [Bacillota bacterium]
MKKFIAALGVTTLLVGGLFFAQPTMTDAMEVEPSVLSVNPEDIV